MPRAQQGDLLAWNNTSSNNRIQDRTEIRLDPEFVEVSRGPNASYHDYVVPENPGGYANVVWWIKAYNPQAISIPRGRHPHSQ
jgi:hypothetical protein